MPNTQVLIPKTLNEQLLYSTVKIICSNGGIGTGFFFKGKISDSENCILLITNKHVIENENKIKIAFHVGINGLPTNENIIVEIRLAGLSFPHPEENIDLVAIAVVPIILQVKNTLNKDIFFSSFDESLIKSEVELLKLTDVRDDVSMIGYPIGLTDSINNFPIFRSGNCASHPGLNFNDQSVGVVDMACFPGSSGSPIVLVKQNIRDDKGNYILGGPPIFIFLGILYGGPYLTNEGKIVEKEIPTSSKQFMTVHNHMIHLGYYIKAKKIFDLVQGVKEIVNKGSIY